jgi:nucleotide-binding universal stress UspA family protein
VLRGSSNSLLLVRASDSPVSWNIGAFKSVVVPLDGSELAESVLPTAADLANSLDLEIVLLRIYGMPYAVRSAGEGFFDNKQIGAFITGLESETREYLEEKTANLRKSGVKNIRTLVRQGLPADEIISCARETPNSLVAMCTHGRSGVKRWVLGSVTETVVRHSTNPVLVVRPPSGETTSRLNGSERCDSSFGHKKNEHDTNQNNPSTH